MSKAIAIFIVIAIAVLLSALFALPVMLLWNWLMPDLFGLREVGFMQAWGLVLLCVLLFKDVSVSSK